MRAGTDRLKQTPHESTVSETTPHTPEISQSNSEQQSRMWNTMRWFDGTERTEAAFHVRFKDLPDEDVTFLKSFYGIGDERELFRMICKFWDVRISHKVPTT